MGNLVHSGSWDTMKVFTEPHLIMLKLLYLSGKYGWKNEASEQISTVHFWEAPIVRKFFLVWSWDLFTVNFIAFCSKRNKVEFLVTYTQTKEYNINSDYNMSKCDHDSRGWYSHRLEITFQMQILTRYQVVANLDHIYFL